MNSEGKPRVAEFTAEGCHYRFFDNSGDKTSCVDLAHLSKQRK